MVLAYHAIFTAYGFWLPNDPRGSSSDCIRAWELLRFGPATKTAARNSVAHHSHDHALRLAGKSALRYPPVSFSGRQCLAVANGFKSAIARSGFRLFACSILPGHVHLVIARHRYPIERVRDQLKGQASKSLRSENVHPFQHILMKSRSPHSPWADGGWEVYLNTRADILRAIQYVEQNPIKEDKPPQRWSFIAPYHPFGV